MATGDSWSCVVAHLCRDGRAGALRQLQESPQSVVISRALPKLNLRLQLGRELPIPCSISNRKHRRPHTALQVGYMWGTGLHTHHAQVTWLTPACTQSVVARPICPLGLICGNTVISRRCPLRHTAVIGALGKHRVARARPRPRALGKIILPPRPEMSENARNH